MKINLPDTVSSRQDLQEVILGVRKYAQWYSQTYVKMRYKPNDKYEVPAISAAATNIINDWNQEKKLSVKRLDELVEALQDLEATAPAMSLTLAAPAPGSLKKELLKWCRKNIAPNILVDFKFNSTILGGMVVSIGSHVYDWSFRREILAALEKFPEVLKNV